MASRKLTTTIRRQLDSFAKKFASSFTDSRRQGFIQDMVAALVAAGHVQLTAVARALSNGTRNRRPDRGQAEPDDARRGAHWLQPPDGLHRRAGQPAILRRGGLGGRLHRLRPGLRHLSRPDATVLHRPRHRRPARLVTVGR
jgi:hypothetical protein